MCFLRKVRMQGGRTSCWRLHRANVLRWQGYGSLCREESQRLLYLPLDTSHDRLCRYDATRIGVSAHDERLSAPFGMIEHLHARKKRIEVHEAHRRTRPGRRRDAHGILITVCMFASFHVMSIPRSSCGVRVCACKSRILV